MALIINKELPNGLKIDNAYCNINNVRCYKNSIEINLSYYVNKTFRFEEKTPLLINTLSLYDVDVCNSNMNTYKFAYTELKKIDEFKDAIDDLEI